MPGTDTDIWAVKLDSEGEIEWQRCYGGWGSEHLENPHTILKIDDNNYVIASSTDYVSDDVQCDIHANWERDAWIFELDIDDTTGFYDMAAIHDNMRVYPNPARDYVVFEIPELNNIQHDKIIIMDVFGREVESLMVKAEKTVWDTREVQSGIYFYNLEIDSKVLSGKIVIQ